MEISTFHKLCDNKGPHLVLFHLKDGNKIGYFAHRSLDSYSGWVIDDFSFIFNLNQGKKYKKLINGSNAFYCNMNCGPSANCLGCNEMVNLNYIYITNNIISKFKNGDKILPNIDVENDEIEYEVLEIETFQIIIG